MMFITILILFISARISTCIFCNDGSNPCHLDNPETHNSYFLPKNGYYCLDAFNGQIICTCPDNSTRRDRPCRICDREPNPCGVGASVITCTDINQGFSCLCNNGQGELVVSTNPCDGTIVKPPPKVICDNGGVADPATNICNCPSGFNGTHCEIRTDARLCDKIECMSNGVCAIRPIVPGGKIAGAKCLCPLGSDGDYCEKPSTIGACTTAYCLHGGFCLQRNIGITQYVSCECKPGWAGLRCDKQYFYCRSAGHFVDEYMKKQGKYFWCIPHKDDYILVQESCAKGLKFNTEKQLCLQ